MRREREQRTFSPRHRPELSPRPGTPSGLFTIYGRRPVLEALRLGVVKSIEIIGQAHGQIVQEIIRQAEALRIPIKRTEHLETDDESVTQGVLAYATPPRVRTDLPRFLEQLPENRLPFLLMLDGVTDPHNFGAILRSAECAGIDAVIVRERRQAPISDVVVKSSAGAAYFVPIFQVTNLAQTLSHLKELGFWSVAAMGSESKNYSEYDWDRAVVLIIGAEGAGVSPLLQRESDDTIRIPMHGQIESLNVSVATGVILFEAAKQRAGTSSNS